METCIQVSQTFWEMHHQATWSLCDCRAWNAIHSGVQSPKHRGCSAESTRTIKHATTASQSGIQQPGPWRQRWVWRWEQASPLLSLTEQAPSSYMAYYFSKASHASDCWRHSARTAGGSLWELAYMSANTSPHRWGNSVLCCCYFNSALYNK